MDGFLAHFHEITLKKRNRPLFEARLLNNLKKAFVKNGGVRIEKISGGFFIVPKAGFDEAAVRDILKATPGIANFMPVFRVKPDMETIKKRLEKEIVDFNPVSFRISSIRSDKNFPLTSEGINRELGEFVKLKTGAIVDLKNPGKTINVEMHSGKAIFYFEKYKGIGGLPVDSGGKAVALLSGGIDSPAASFMMMKRGCRVVFVHFHAYPFLNRASIEKAEELVKTLDRHQHGSKLFLVPFGEIQKKIVLSAPEKYRVVIYRRLMMGIASQIAEKEKAGALITGESLGQVASQTMENMSVVSRASGFQILRPLIGMDKEEIIDLAKKIGTYEISIIPDQDCCQLFTPRHPATKARLSEIEKAEENFDVKKMILEAIEAAETKEYN
ncbi:MAG: tRNA 4-thiouridine(8) synthase ThiI [Candidatus Pacebacteria bacterium]|nr:tRNA 4-thiouridine(8) synthase ThiI [Candidatus Paceibacterota bacterium]